MRKPRGSHDRITSVNRRHARRVPPERLYSLDGLSPSHLREIEQQITVHRLPAGRLLFKRGQSGDKAYFRIDGVLDLIDAGFTVRPFAADDDENYLAVDNYPRHTVNAITRDSATLYSIDRDKLDLLMAWTQATSCCPASTTATARTITGRAAGVGAVRANAAGQAAPVREVRPARWNWAKPWCAKAKAAIPST